MVPDIPAALQIKIRREEYLAKKALEGQDEPPPLDNNEMDGATSGKDNDSRGIVIVLIYPSFIESLQLK